MAYEYDVDILAALWTGAEDGEEPYASIIAADPDLFDEDAEVRILSTVEVVRSHIELLEDRDEARLLHFCLSAMLEGVGSGGFVYGATSTNENAVVTGNVREPVFVVGDEIDLGSIDGVTITGAGIGTVTATGTDLDTVVADINAALGGSDIVAVATPDRRLRISQLPVGGAGADSRAIGFAVTRGIAANDNITTKAGIIADATPPAAGDPGTIYLPKVTEVANAARDRAVQVFLGQIRDPSLV